MFNLILSSDGSGSSNWMSYVLLAVLVVAIIAMLVISTRRNKKRQQEAEKLINAVKPGNKVKTIGGICGIVVEVDDEENTFVLETGSEASGKSYMKFDKQAIYQTDAVVEPDNSKEEKGKEESGHEGEEPFGDVSADAEQTAGGTKAEEKAEESKDTTENS